MFRNAGSCKSGLALGGLALTGGRALAQGSAVTLRMSSTLPNDPVNSAHAVWYNRFAANLKTAVGDKVVVNYFPSDQLGKEVGHGAAGAPRQRRHDDLGHVDLGDADARDGRARHGLSLRDNDHCGRALDGKAGTILGNMLRSAPT